MTALPPNVDRFVRGAMRSIWDLELLLRLHRERERIWTADALVRELRASALIVADALAALEKAGLVAQSEPENYRYWPVTPELDRVVGDLAAAYASFPTAVTEAILSAPNANIRIFADAFRIKKD